MFDQVRRMKKRQLAFKALHIAMIVSTAVMAWKGLKCLTGCERPLFVEISGSMEPAFHRGDLLFLTDKKEEPIRVGEIVVFKVEGLRNLIVHRVIKLHESEDGSVKFLTKGDSNGVDDRNLYADGQFFVERKDVIGRVRGFVPYLGKVTIMLDRYTYLKYAFLVVLGLVNCEYRRLAIAVASCLLAGDLFY